MFKAEAKKISDLFNRKIMSVPRNQRKYVWDKTNWEDIFDDLKFIFDNKSKKQNHFIGSIVLQIGQEEKGLASCSIIDGQQRTVTITLFMLALLLIFKENSINDSFIGTKKYLFFIDDEGKEQFILSSPTYISIKNIASKIIDKKNSYSINNLIKKYIINKDEKLYGDCLKYFYLKLQNIGKSYTDLKAFLNGIRDALIQTNYIEISATSEEDSYTIFEILNARGMELEDHELVKNYIMRYIIPQTKVDEVKERWQVIENELDGQINRFFLHYASHRFNVSNKHVFRTIQNNIKRDQVKDLFDDILLKMKYYKIIISPIKDGESKNCNTIEYELFTFLNAKRAEQFRPLFLSLMHVKDRQLITEEEYNKTLKFIYTFFVCFNIIGQLRSNRLTDALEKYTKSIENNFKTNYIDELKESLKEKLPTFQVFMPNFKEIGWSHKYGFYKDSKRKANVQTILELIEKNVSKNQNVQEFTIEHILDDAKEIENAKIGNLLPLEEHLNSSCKGKTFTEKLKIYQQSNFKMTRDFAIRYKSESSFSPNKRAEYLAKYIYNDILKLQTIDK